MSSDPAQRLIRSPCALTGAWLAALLCLPACGAAPLPKPNMPPTAESAARAEAKALRSGPVVLRYNPAPCACPAFEARATGGWLRAELDLQALPDAEAWLAHLARLGDEQLPVPVQADAAGDGELYRTWQGVWTVRVTVQRVLAPLLPPAAPEPAPASAPAAPESGPAPAVPAPAPAPVAPESDPKPAPTPPGATVPAQPLQAGDEAPKRSQR